MMRRLIGVALVGVGLFFGNSGFGQCSAPVITQQSYCINQQAEIRIDDADPNVRYHWYHDAGTVRIDDGYGFDGDGRYFVSPILLTSTGPHSFYYAQEISYNSVGPAYMNPTGGQLYSADQSDYLMTFDAAQSFTLDSITVVVEMTDDSELYHFELVHTFNGDTSYSNSYIASRGNFENISGDLYSVRLPVVGLGAFPAGNGHTLQLNSVTNVTDGYSAVDGIYWYGAGVYGGGSYADNNITTYDPTGPVDVTTGSPLMMDWAVTIVCDQTEVVVTESTDCCTPVGSDFDLSTISPVNLFTAGELPVNIDAAGTDVNGTMFYFWYDESGNLLSNGAGLDSYSALAFGQYTLRVVNAIEDTSSAACFAVKNILIDSASIYVNSLGDACGAILDLEASGGLGNYTWSDIGIQGYGTMSTTTGSTTTLTMTESGTYTVSVTGDILGGEVAADGSFEQWSPTGPSRFETTYAQGNGLNLSLPGQYYIDDVINAYSDTHCDAAINSNVMAIDAASDGTGAANTEAYANNRYVWRMSSQPVRPNTTYTFSVDVANWPSGTGNPIMMLVGGGAATPTALNLSIDGVPVGGTVALINGACTWRTVSGTWDSGTNTTATFLFAETGRTTIGHEVMFDNVSFNTGVTQETTEYEFTVNLPQAPETDTVCVGTTAQLEIGDGSKWLWLEDDLTTEIGLEDGSPVSWSVPATPGTYQVSFQSAESASYGANLGPAAVGSYYNTSVRLVVNEISEFTSFDVRLSTSGPCGWPSPATVPYTFTLSGSGINETYSVDLTCNSATTVTLNQVLQPGTYTLSSSGQLLAGGYNVFGTSSTPGGEVSYSLVSGNNVGFYNMIFGASSACTPVLMDIVAETCCTPPGATVAIQGAVNDTIKACNDTTITANISGGGSVFQWYQIGTGTFGAEGGAPGATETSGTISTSGWYSIHVADNSAGLTSCADGDTVYVLITATPTAPSVTTPVNICTGEQLNLAVTSPNGSYTYNWTGPNTYTATGATPTVIASATLTPTNHSGTYSVTATENGCISTGTDVTVNITQSPSIAAVNVDTTFCAYNFDLSTLHGVASNGTITYHGDAPGYTNLGGSTVSADGTYHLVVTDGSCADTTSVTTDDTGDPTGAWSGGTGVCTGNSTDLTLAITGGTGPFTVYYHDGTAVQTATNQTATDVISLGAGTYTLDSVVDNNGCSHLNIADAETIATQDDVDATVSVLCNGETGVDGALAFNEFQIMVNIDAGDTSNVAIDIVGTTYGVTFSETSTGIWHSTPIVEDTTLSILIRDTRCDTITESYNRVCSCPGVATLTGATTVCNNETADLTLTMNGVGPFDFEFHRNGVVYNSGVVLGTTYSGTQTGVPLLGSPTTITITVADSGTYTIENLLDYEGGATACAGSEIGTILVGFHTHPDGDIVLDATTGANPICLDANTDVDIEVTQGAVGPFTAYYTNNGSQTTGVTTGTNIGTINVTSDTGTVVLDSIVDNNGCASGLINETLTITAHDTLDVTATVVCGDDAGTATPNDGFHIEVTTATSTILNVTETSGNSLSFTNAAGTWSSGVTNETNSVDIQVTDVNGCHTVTLTDLQKTCSCPTVAVLTHAATPEACAGDQVTLQIDTTAGTMSSTNFTGSITSPTGAIIPLNIPTGTVFPYEFMVADSGEYTLTVFTDNTGDNGSSCDAQLDDDTARVHIYSLPTASLAGGSESCIGSPSDPITLTLTGAGSNWNVDYTQSNTSGTVNDDDNIITTGGTSTLISSTSSAADSGTYVLTSVEMSVGNNLTCTATNLGSTSPSISFSPAQGASIDSDVSICADSSGVLTANDEGGGVTYTWSLGGQDVGTGLIHNVINAPGVYTLTTEKNGCSDQTDVATVTVTTISVTAIATPVVISEGDNVTLSSITNGTNCEWFDPSLVSIGTSCTESYAAPAPGGFYTVISTDGMCVGSAQVEITVVQPIKVPDAFTPNGDAVNDAFTITGIETYSNASIAIYNRWGNVVFRMLDGANYALTPWDGTVNGKELPAGVYYYTIDLGLSVEEAELVPDAAPISGSVILMK